MTEARDEPGGRRGRSDYWRDIRRRKEEIVSVREEMTRRRTRLAAAIDRTGEILAHPVFFALVVAAHLAWLLLNSGWIPGVTPWDSYPFAMLATIASAEAPFIALLILMRQSRDQHIDELREEVSLQVELHMERETSRALEMLAAIQDHLGIERPDDDDLERMTDPVDPRDLIRSLRERLDEAEETPPGDPRE
jgi:uncharacterized membrane protein